MTEPTLPRGDSVGLASAPAHPCVRACARVCMHACLPVWGGCLGGVCAFCRVCLCLCVCARSGSRVRACVCAVSVISHGSVSGSSRARFVLQEHGSTVSVHASFFLWTACHHVQASKIWFMSMYMPRLQPMAAPAISATSACRPGSNTGRSGGPFPHAPLVQLMSETPSVHSLLLQRKVLRRTVEKPSRQRW